MDAICKHTINNGITLALDLKNLKDPFRKVLKRRDMTSTIMQEWVIHQIYIPTAIACFVLPFNGGRLTSLSLIKEIVQRTFTFLPLLPAFAYFLAADKEDNKLSEIGNKRKNLQYTLEALDKDKKIPNLDAARFSLNFQTAVYDNIEKYAKVALKVKAVTAASFLVAGFSYSFQIMDSFYKNEGSPLAITIGRIGLSVGIPAMLYNIYHKAVIGSKLDLTNKKMAEEALAVLQPLIK